MCGGHGRKTNAQTEKMQRIVISLLTIAFILTPPAAGGSTLYPFGPEAGDESLGPGDDASSPAFDLTTAFPFFGSPQSTVYVSIHSNHCTRIITNVQAEIQWLDVV